MFDRPSNYESVEEWFAYFRMSKAFSSIPKKFETEIKLVQTPEQAKVIMTAYAATALDIATNFPTGGFRIGVVKSLRDNFNLKPQALLALSTTKIAETIKCDVQELNRHLQKEGFKIESDVVEGYGSGAAQKKLGYKI